MGVVESLFRRDDENVFHRSLHDGASYASSRDFASSARLNFQSYLWRDSLGYTLHPNIWRELGLSPSGTSSPQRARSRDSEPVRIADIGTGTGVWLIHLSQELEASDARQVPVQLHGFDVDLTQVPPKDWLPSNVEIHQWNAFDDVLGQYEGYFDVIHVRLFMINVKTTEGAMKLVRNLDSMLKPGGWLQWEEVDNTDNHVTKINEHIATPAMDAIVQYVRDGSKKQRGEDDWFVNLPSTLKTKGFEQILMRRHVDPPLLRRLFYESWLLTLEEFSLTRLKGTEQGIKNLQLIKESHEECIRGAAIQLGKLALIARKTT